MLRTLSARFSGISYLASFSIVTFGLWFIVMGLFTKGGRGWCNFLCPAGALMGLSHWIGVKLKIGWLVKIDQAACVGCAKCVTNCPAWAITRDKAKSVSINRHACTACMACAPSLSLLALPLLADGAIFLSTKVLKRRAEEAE